MLRIKSMKKLIMISSILLLTSCATNDADTYVSIGSGGKAGHDNKLDSDIKSEIIGIDKSKDTHEYSTED